MEQEHEHGHLHEHEVMPKNTPLWVKFVLPLTGLLASIPVLHLILHPILSALGIPCP